jgi:hypothetical protein
VVASDSSCCTSSLPCCAVPGDLDLRLGVAAPEGEGSAAPACRRTPRRRLTGNRIRRAKGRNPGLSVTRAQLAAKARLQRTLGPAPASGIRSAQYW